jgi:hypothetical protein
MFNFYLMPRNQARDQVLGGITQKQTWRGSKKSGAGKKWSAVTQSQYILENVSRLPRRNPFRGFTKRLTKKSF